VLNFTLVNARMCVYRSLESANFGIFGYIMQAHPLQDFDNIFTVYRHYSATSI